MAKNHGDPYLKIAKPTLVGMLRSMESERNWYERLETLRARGIQPLAVDSIDIAEFNPEYPDEHLNAEVWAPNGNDGGVVRLVWSRTPAGRGRDLTVYVHGWEKWSHDQAGCSILAYRVLAERLRAKIDRKRHPELYSDAA